MVKDTLVGIRRDRVPTKIVDGLPEKKLVEDIPVGEPSATDMLKFQKPDSKLAGGGVNAPRELTDIVYSTPEKTKKYPKKKSAVS